MTASHVASILRAKRAGKGKWMAKCPSHPDRRPSLSIREGKRGVLLKCWSNGCSTDEICDSMGIRVTDLFYDRSIDPQIRARMTLEEQRDTLERKYTLASMLAALEPKKRNYWRKVESGTLHDLQLVRAKLEPEQIIREWRSRQWQRMGISSREKHLDMIYRTQILTIQRPKLGV